MVRIVPGSHLRDLEPWEERFITDDPHGTHPAEETAVVAAGSALLLNTYTFHRAECLREKTPRSLHFGFTRVGAAPGALLRLAGQKRKAIQYVVGNPLFVLQMTQHDIRASLYAPLRVLVYENDEGTTCVEYDKPSSLFGQFGNERIGPTAAMLDKKLETLVAAVFE